MYALPGAKVQHEHGTRSRYVLGCRCFACRRANTAYYHARKGQPWNGLVDAEPVRCHLRALSRQGIGDRAVSAASDVGRSTLHKILRGERTKIRQQAANRILAVTAEAASDHALIPAGPTWRMLRVLEEEFGSKAAVARQLGYRTPAIQIRRGRVLARTEAARAPAVAVGHGRGRRPCDGGRVSVQGADRPRLLAREVRALIRSFRVTSLSSGHLAVAVDYIPEPEEPGLSPLSLFDRMAVAKEVEAVLNRCLGRAS